jgi:bacillaene synthase trans-acting acyltransferase
MANAKTAFMFSGQGSQHFQMGRTLFDQEPAFRDCMLRLDGTVRDLTGKSVVETLYTAGHPKSATFDRTLLTHPSIFMVEYSLAQCLIQAGVTPELTLGASLGTFAAATVAGLIAVDDALTCVVRQAKNLEENCKPGGMIAVLADPVLYTEGFLAASSELAAVNFASNFVVSARREWFVEMENYLRRRDVTYQRLPVSFAFHSQWIDEARAPFEAFAKSIACKAGGLPFVCCESADIVPALSADYLWRVVRRPIRFRETIAKLERGASYRYIDVGPASTLATFLKYGLPPTSKSTIHPILTPFGQEQKNLSAAISATRAGAP